LIWLQSKRIDGAFSSGRERIRQDQRTQEDARRQADAARQGGTSQESGVRQRAVRLSGITDTETIDDTLKEGQVTFPFLTL
jgi:hypothetical protein